MRLTSPIVTALLIVSSACSPRAHWGAAAPIPQRLQEHHGALLHGRVYIAGGFDSTGAPTGVAWRYEPASNRWSRVADLPEARHHMPLVVLHDTLYAIGGLAGMRFVAQGTVWAYREDGDRWEPRAPLPEPRGASAAAVVGDRIVVVGGYGLDRRLLDSTLVFDPAAGRWTQRAPIPTPRDHLTAEVVGGTLYAIGGRPIFPDSNYSVVEAYDLATDRWTPRSMMPSRRGGLASAVLNGEIHTFGGETRTSVFDNHEIYDPATDTWRVAARMPTARHGLAAVEVGGKIYVIGGGPKAGLAQTAIVEVWRP